MRTYLCAVAAVLLALLACPVASAGASLPVPVSFHLCPLDSGAVAPLLRLQNASSSNESLVEPRHTRTFQLDGELADTLQGGSYALLVQSVRGASEELVLLHSSYGSLASFIENLGGGVPAGAASLQFEWGLAQSVELRADDRELVLYLRMSDQAEQSVLCALLSLPLQVEPTPEPEEEEASTSKPLGYVCALISVLFFGTNFLPVKAFPTGDGVFFQWLLCLGIWLAGLMVQLIRQSTFEPLAMLGGVMWCVGNMATVPIIQMIGLGVGMCLWGTATLIMGWASGRFGLLGVDPQTIENDAMNIVGLILCVCSMGIMYQVKSVKEEQQAAGLDHVLLDHDPMSITAEGLLASGAPAAYQLRKTAHGSSSASDDGMGSPSLGAVQAPAQSSGSWVDHLSLNTRRVLGVALCIFAGSMYGLNFNPPQYLIDSGKGASSHGIDYVFSHFCGILLTSTAYLVAYCVYTRNQPWVSSPLVLPGLCSGVGWAIAQISWFVANDQIHFVGTFPIVSTGPGIVATLCAIVFFKEIQGRRNYMFLLATAVVVFVGVILIALSLPAGS